MADVFITSYPERWDFSSKKSQFFELLRKMVEKRPRERFGSKLLFHKILEESMKFQANISSNLLSSYNVSSVGQSSVGASRQKQVDAASYLEIFRREVMRIVSVQTLNHREPLSVVVIAVSLNGISGEKWIRSTRNSSLAKAKRMKISLSIQSGPRNALSVWTTFSTG